MIFHNVWYLSLKSIKFCHIVKIYRKEDFLCIKDNTFYFEGSLIVFQLFFGSKLYRFLMNLEDDIHWFNVQHGHIYRKQSLVQSIYKMHEIKYFRRRYTCIRKATQVTPSMGSIRNYHNDELYQISNQRRVCHDWI